MDARRQWLPRGLRQRRSPAAGQARAAAANSIVDAFWWHVDEREERPALRWHEGARWRTLTWGGYGTAVERAASHLLGLGVQPGDRVGILSNNRWEWHVADLAIMSVGAVSVPIYASNAASQVAHAIRHAGVSVCFVEDSPQLAKILLRRAELPELAHVVVIEPVEGLDDGFVEPLPSLLHQAAPDAPDRPGELDERIAAIRPGDLATLVFTSGTTGPPKATMLTHGNVIENLRNVTAMVPIGPDDRFLSFLPLSHIAERSVSHFGQIVSGGQTWFAANLASLPEDLRACRPTIFFAVPRVWEKFRDALQDAMVDQRGPSHAMVDRYLHITEPGPRGAGAGGARLLAGHLEAATLGAVINRSIRSRVGLDHARLLVSGAAPLAPDVLTWFARFGLPIAEVYGQTEGCGVTTLNPPDALRLGTVGPGVPNVEVRIADDGEVLVRGAAVTPGYFRDPDSTRELLDAGGWMHSGDLGSLDEDGYLTITGRKKDLIITSSGKNVSPQELELDLRSEPLISQAVVVGDNRPYLGALLALDPEAVGAWAAEHGRSADDPALLDDEELRDEVNAAVARVSARHARIEGIKRWRLLPHDLSIEDGTLTPTLKVKRELVTARFADLVEDLYRANGHR